MDPAYIPDAVVAPVSAAALGAYHLWLARQVRRHPERTVYGLAAAARRLWIAAIMYRKEEILAVQTLRNYIMAASLLATTSVAIIFGVVAFLSNLGKGSEPSSASLFAFTNNTLFGIKVLCFLLSQIIAFFFLTQAMRFYNHVAMTVNVNVTEEELQKLNAKAAVAYEHLDADSVGDMMNRGSMFYTMAMRMYYVSFPLLAWFAGAWAMAAATVILLVALSFLDFSQQAAPLTRLAAKRLGSHDGETSADAKSDGRAPSDDGASTHSRRVHTVEKPKGLKFHKREPHTRDHLHSNLSQVSLSSDGLGPVQPHHAV
ncbi:hypothetical protein HK105_209134 [Polyrhizophydium stewartii]|uniref:DUF599 domain-containing protein n=1 Tax=Polyrhizophydium stewartii TaxID=2732419 RepID=A0ABR4MVW5_9FUNG|nr:hypothetical protein HK105_006161 [Polyrhizophydium stewartii]